MRKGGNPILVGHWRQSSKVVLEQLPLMSGRSLGGLSSDKSLGTLPCCFKIHNALAFLPEGF